jgi:hypothetical protein
MKNHRMERERKTVEAMIDIYCNARHEPRGKLCRECGELLAYAERRLAKCPFQQRKTTCANCRVHCYTSVMRKKIKQVMRFSGPRMLLRHPVLALLHFIDGLRKEPAPP